MDARTVGDARLSRCMLPTATPCSTTRRRLEARGQPYHRAGVPGRSASLILDEATSSVDYLAERHHLEGRRRGFSKPRRAFVIVYRLRRRRLSFVMRLSGDRRAGSQSGAGGEGAYWRLRHAWVEGAADLVSVPTGCRWRSAPTTAQIGGSALDAVEAGPLQRRGRRNLVQGIRAHGVLRSSPAARPAALEPRGRR